MTAEILREAVALMRSRAEAASPGPWVGVPGDVDRHSAHVKRVPGVPVVTAYCDADAEHIASWHPAVALAVADWLDDEADEEEGLILTSALMVARAYLGRTDG